MKKLPVLLIILITFVIFLGWVSNLKYVWRRNSNQGQGEFISFIKESVFKFNKSFKDLQKDLKESVKSLPISSQENRAEKIDEFANSPLPLNQQELIRLKEKILEYEKQETTK